LNMTISHQVESVLADSNAARQRTGMVASPVQVVMLVRQDGRGGRSRRRPETFRNVAKRAFKGTREQKRRGSWRAAMAADCETLAKGHRPAATDA